MCFVSFQLEIKKERNIAILGAGDVQRQRERVHNAAAQNDTERTRGCMNLRKSNDTSRQLQLERIQTEVSLLQGKQRLGEEEILAVICEKKEEVGLGRQA